MPKKIKKEKIKEIIKTTNTKLIQVPLAGVIVFLLLLATSSFFAGAAWLKTTGNASEIVKTTNSTFEPTKSNKPLFQIYTMSFCPYGNQMEDLVKPVAELLGKSVDIRPQYIFDKIEGNLITHCQTNAPDPKNCAQYVASNPEQIKDIDDCKKQIAEIVKECNDEKSYLKIGNNYLHGRVEANQNVREICAYNLNEDKTNWWKFIENINTNCNSTNADTCWEDQAKKAGFDTNSITECFNNQAGELIEKEIALTTQYKIQGSPTLKINDADFPPESAYTADNKGSLKIGKKIFTQDQYRTSDAIKEAICASFNRPPKECKTTLKAVIKDTGSVEGATDASCN